MKKILLSSILSASLFGASNGVYIELGVGLNIDNKLKMVSGSYRYEDSFIGSIALGYQMNLVRLELESKYKKEKLYSYSGVQTSGDFTQHSQMFNLYYSGYNYSKLTTSIGGGIGISDMALENIVQLSQPQNDVETNNIFAYQGMFSVGYMINKNITTTIKYCYFNTIKNDDFDSNSDSSISLLFRYLF